ncbi:MAG: class II aldolase/adducin family protein [Staphylothermus sp.]|nr:class II aldolase/adducin family protein [Staphylothermus sp.]
MDKAELLIEAMKLLVQMGLTNPKGGNASIRISENEILITPSGYPKHLLRPEVLVVYNIDTGEYLGTYKPSIEVNAHRLIYLNRRDVKVVIHAHAPLSTALVDAGLDKWWETGTVESNYSLGKVSIASEAPPGSLELAKNVADKARYSKIVIVPRHGVFALGKDVEDALDAIISLEMTAKYFLVKTLITKINCIQKD